MCYRTGILILGLDHVKEYIPAREYDICCQGEARNAIGYLLFLLSHPFRGLLFQFLFAGQVELVFAGVNVGVFGKGTR